MSEQTLNNLLRSGDAPGVRNFFRKATEAARDFYRPVVTDWVKLLRLNQSAQWSKKAERALEGVERIDDPWRCMLATQVAAVAVLLPAAMFKQHLPLYTSDESVVGALEDRRAPWLQEFAQKLCETTEIERFSGGTWRLLRDLIQRKLITPPDHDFYAIGALNGIWPPFQKNAPRPELPDLLRNESDWLDTAFWKLFAIEGTGEVSLANCDKYGGASWVDSLVALSEEGILSRERLLDESLAALTRDFLQFRAGWFSRFHEALQPTPEERSARTSVYLQLLGSSIPPTVSLAVDAISTIDENTPIDAAALLDTLPSVLNSRGKAVAKKALKLLDRVAKREPEFRSRCCVLAVAGLLNDAADVQKQIFDLLDRHGSPDDSALIAALSEFGDATLASLRQRLEKWQPREKAPASAAPADSASGVTPPPSRIDPARAIKPIESFAELLHAASAVLESPGNPEEIERVLDGISRLNQDRPPDFKKQVAPLRVRAMKKGGDGSGPYPFFDVECWVAGVFLAWIDGNPALFRRNKKKERDNGFLHLVERAAFLAEQVCAGVALPLLSAPTHTGSWIEPIRLVERALAWQEAGREPVLAEQVIALLRMAPEGRDLALPAAKELRGEWGAGIRVALGCSEQTGENVALWLAAWRSRQPFGDLPDFEKVHPGFGANGGAGATYQWSAIREFYGHPEPKYQTVKVGIRTTPKPTETPSQWMLPLRARKAAQFYSEEANAWEETLWPANREAIFANAITPLADSVTYCESSERSLYPVARLLSDPHVELRPMARLALAFALASQDSVLRGFAVEGLISAIADGRLDVESLGADMSLLLDTNYNPLCRWAKELKAVATVSPWHAETVTRLMQRILQGDPAQAPKNVFQLLEVLVELRSQTGISLDPKTATYLNGIKTGGKTAQLVRALLI